MKRMAQVLSTSGSQLDLAIHDGDPFAPGHCVGQHKKNRNDNELNRLFLQSERVSKKNPNNSTISTEHDEPLTETSTL